MLNVPSTIQTATDFRERALKALGQLPPFSPVLNRLLASLADDEAFESIRSDIIFALSELGHPIVFWTIDESERLKLSLEAAPLGVMTNKPGLVRKMLKEAMGE